MSAIPKTDRVANKRVAYVNQEPTLNGKDLNIRIKSKILTSRNKSILSLRD